MYPTLKIALASRDLALAQLAHTRHAHRNKAPLDLPSHLHEFQISTTGDSIGKYMSKWSEAPGDGFPNVAIGVTASEDGSAFRLAVRLQDKVLHVDSIGKLIAEMTHHEPEVRFIGAARALAASQQSQHRPLEPGLSVSHMLGSTGTIGCVVNEVATGKELLLSNNHIFANENQASRGDNIYQPGSIDGGTVLDKAAELVRFETITFGGNNEIDAALAECSGTTCHTRPTGLQFSGQPRSTQLSRGVVVSKIGRSTGLTTSTVSAIGVKNIHVNYVTGSAIFDDQVEIQAPATGLFADNGDSGSLVVDGVGDAVALLFAVTESGTAYGNPIATVLSKLGITLA